VGLTPANVAVLKNGRAKAVRFSTLESMCRVLECQPGDLLEFDPSIDSSGTLVGRQGLEP
jgi:putative transcriptional regulator